MHRYFMLFIFLLFSIVAQAQDDATVIIDRLAERYQSGDVILMDALEQSGGETLAAAIAARLPDAAVEVYTGTLDPPETPRRLFIILFDTTAPVPDMLGTRYARIDRMDTGTMTLVTYQRTPGLLQPLATFGDNVVLMGWKIRRNARVRPCDVLTLESWWSITAPVSMDYSLTFTLNPLDKDGIARTDGAPGGGQMRLWQVNGLYYDERDLTVPCDAAPGEYFLVAGIYDWTNGASLYVLPDEGLRASLMALRITDD